MKGLMVTLLILSCTGMVFAQQGSNYNGFRPRNGAEGTADRSNGDAPVVPIMSRDGSASANVTTQPATNSRSGTSFESSQGQSGFSRASTTLSAPPAVRKNFAQRDSGLSSRPSTNEAPRDVIYLGLPASELAGLYRDGAVEAPISDPFVKRITISDKNRPSSNPVRHIQPRLVGEKLVFQFDQDTLSSLGDYSYEFDVPENLRGKYRSAVIQYPPALQRSATQTTGQTGGQFQTGSQFRAEDNRWRLAGGQQDPKPVTDLYEQQRRAQMERDRQLKLARQEELERQKWAQNQFEKEKTDREKQELADRNRWLQSQLDQMRLQQQRDAELARQRTTLPANRYANGQFDPTYPVTRPVAPPSNNETLAISMMQQLQTRLAQLETENFHLNKEVRSVKSENDSLLRRFDYSDQNRRDLANHRRDVKPVDDSMDVPPTIRSGRTLMSTGGFDLNDAPNDRQASNVNGGVTDESTSQESQRGSLDLLMFVMLLMSVALNLYLWAVSRGFYMRYQELADELRETFAVTA